MRKLLLAAVLWCSAYVAFDATRVAAFAPSPERCWHETTRKNGVTTICTICIDEDGDREIDCVSDD